MRGYAYHPPLSAPVSEESFDKMRHLGGLLMQTLVALLLIFGAAGYQTRGPVDARHAVD